MGSVKRAVLSAYLDQLLNAQAISDYAPNGLQVQGKNEIKKIITGVTACQAVLDEAVRQQADAIIVHHGYFWKGEDPCVVGMKHHRLKTLLNHEMNLFAYHLPLDIHPTLGNNIQLANLMGWQVTGELDTQTQPSMGLTGTLSAPMTLERLSEMLAVQLGQAPIAIAAGDHHIKTIAWCTGAAHDFVAQAAAAGVDAYVTGEIAERTVYEARELGIHFLAAGHHATERGGVQALGQHLAERFKLDVEFVEVDNPV